MYLKIKKDILIYKEIEFDDWDENHEDYKDQYPYWGFLCGECYSKYKSKLNDTSVSESAGEEICGIVGCNNKSDTHYIEFPRNPAKSYHYLKELFKK